MIHIFGSSEYRLCSKITPAILTPSSLLVAGPVSICSFPLPSLCVAAVSQLQHLPSARATAPQAQATWSAYAFPVCRVVCVYFTFCLVPEFKWKASWLVLQGSLFYVPPQQSIKWTAVYYVECLTKGLLTFTISTAQSY
jgi:hypothetical protein